MSTFEKIRKAALARLEAGEPVHIILQDYADYEDELRPVLEATTGNRIKTTAPKMKPKNTEKSSTLFPILLTGTAILVILAIGAFIWLPQSDAVTTVISQSDTTCVGIPVQQITSTYALRDNNQQQSYNSSTHAIGGAAPAEPEVVYESARSDDMSAVTAVAMPTALPPSSYGAGGGLGDDAVGVGMEVSDAEEAEAPADMDMSGEADGVGADAVVYDTVDRDEAVAPPAAPNRVSDEPLRAGEIDDNVEWDTYQEYRNDFLEDYGTASVRDVDTTGRQIIRVVDNNGLPVLGACVEIYNGDSHITSSYTYATGLTLFFPNLNDNTRYVDTFNVVVSHQGVVTQGELNRENIGGVTEFQLDLTQQQDTIELDIVFLLDATGSMSDEIAQLQGNILTISEQINALEGNIDVRYGLVTYRDRGDQYVTRVHEFTDDVTEFQNLLLNVVAGGGGDYPESLNEGLDMALNAVEWRGRNAIQLVFLVADAPPHIDYRDDADYSLLMQDALARGIKIHPIASSGLEPEGEFVLRQIGQYTMGRFLFLTYEEGVAGTPGDERPDLEVGDPEDEQGVGDYSVSQLDELVLRLITDEINALQGQ